MGAWWFLPVMLALGTLMPLLNNVPRTGYAVADLSSAGIGLAYNAPLLAAATAYAYRGWAKYHRTIRSVRSGPSILVQGGWPLLLGGPVTGCVAVMSAAWTIPTDAPSLVLLLTFFVVLLCSAVLGAALSWATPVVLSVPLASIVCFVWVNYLPVTDSRKLHNLTPTIDGFATSSQLATSAAVGLVVVSLTVVVGFLVLLTSRRWDRLPRPVATLLVAVVLAGAGAAGWGSLHFTSQPLNLLAAEPRSSALACTDQAELRVCLWPENAARGAVVAELAVKLNGPLSDWGQPTIIHVSEGHTQPDAAGVDAGVGSTDDDLIASLASGYLDQRRGCEVTLSRKTDNLAALLLLAADASTARDVIPEELLAAATDRLARPSAEIRAWYEAEIRKLSCTAP